MATLEPNRRRPAQTRLPNAGPGETDRLARVNGGATFYHLFRLKPAGAHTCVVCIGTDSFVKGAEALVASAEGACGVSAGPGVTHAGWTSA